jgi:pyridoxamine 5'-phosphate oxidase
MEVPGDPAASGYDHVGQGLRRSDLDPNPIRQFANWFTAAIEASIRDVNAMSLATAGRDARPSVRIVLLKSFDQDGFVFFTNYESAKGKQLDANPYAALGFYWIELDRQIRISGKVEKTSREESQAYFHSRPLGSQLSAWASRQSEIVDARRVLDARMAEMTERFRKKRIPLPAHWGGYQLKPDVMEFWQGRPNRLHDRFRYTRLANESWQIDRLAP